MLVELRSTAPVPAVSSRGDDPPDPRCRLRRRGVGRCLRHPLGPRAPGTGSVALGQLPPPHSRIHPGAPPGPRCRLRQWGRAVPSGTPRTPAGCASEPEPVPSPAPRSQG